MINRTVFELGSPEILSSTNESNENVKESADDVEEPKAVKDSDRDSQYAALLISAPADYESEDDDVFNDESTCAVGKHVRGPGIYGTCWSETPCLCDMGHQQLMETATGSHKMSNPKPVKAGKCAHGIKVSGPIAGSKKAKKLKAKKKAKKARRNDTGSPDSVESAVEKRARSKLYKLEIPEAVDVYYRRLRDRILRKREPQFSVNQQEEMMGDFEMENNCEVFEGFVQNSSPLYPEHTQFSDF